MKNAKRVVIVLDWMQEDDHDVEGEKQCMVMTLYDGNEQQEDR